MKLELVKYDLTFLRLSWNWLNDAEVKELTNTPKLDEEYQKIWFSEIENKKDYLIWGLVIGKNKIGACGLKNIVNSQCEYWGYIGEKSFWGQGVGYQILLLMEKEAIDRNIYLIWLKVLKINSRALNLYLRFGFKIDKDEMGFYLMSKKIA